MVANGSRRSTDTKHHRRARIRRSAQAARSGLFVVLAIALVMGMASSPVQAAPQTSNIDVDDAVTSGTNSFTYSGVWVNCGACNSGAFSNSFRYSYSPGANATLSFSGTQATLYGYRERTGGIANVSVDNGPPVQVDYYSADQKLVEVYKSPVLKSGLHRLTLTVTGKRGAGVSPTINIDRAVIESGAGSLPPATAPPAAAPPVDNPATGPGAGRWMSGASGEGVGNGKFGVWRGTTVPLAVTWSDISFDAAVNSYQFEPGAEYGSWTGSADWAFGGIWAGDTWSAAASGAYDSRWSQILSNLKNKWQARQRGTLYIRFAHEMNGNWSNHSVSASDAKYFVTAWKRFYAIKQRVFPGARVTSAQMATLLANNTTGEHCGREMPLWMSIPLIGTRPIGNSVAPPTDLAHPKDWNNTGCSPKNTANRSRFPNGEIRSRMATNRNISSTCMTSLQEMLELAPVNCFMKAIST